MSAVDENQDETLRRQFEQLQAQQQRRLQLLQRRKELDKTKKERNDTMQHSTVHDTKTTAAFGVGDNLDLKAVEPSRRDMRRDVTRDVTDTKHSFKTTDELNEQIRELKDETGRLCKLLGERDIELRTVRRKLDEDRAVQSTGVAADAPAATKIVELSKRVRELTAELEAEKTKSKQLIRKYQELEKQTVDTTSESHTTSDLVPGSVDEMKSLQEKLKQSELKVAEQRNQIQTLKAELKVMHKVLSQEVGEGVQLQSLLNASSGWRGRAQQIAALQKKVNELRRQVEQQQKLVADGDMSDMLGDDMLTHRVAAGRSVNAVGSGLDEKQKDKIRLIEKHHKETNEKLAVDLKNLEQENELLKQKVDASKARITILSTENKTHKQQIQTLLDKGRHDDELIEALFKQQSQLKQSMEESMKQLEQRTTETQQVKQQSTVKQQQDGNVVEHLKAILLDKETKVKKLELELRQLQIGLATERTQRHNTTGSELNSYRRSPDDIRPDIAARIIDEVLSPTPPVHRDTSSHGSRPQSRTNIDTNSHNNFTSSRPAARDSSDSVELQLKCQELNSLYQATSVEKDRLTELVQVLEKRIQEATFKVTDSLTELQTQRRKNALLEKQLGKAKIEQTHSTARKNKNKSNSSGSVRDSMAGDDFGFTNVEELRTKLDIQRDENEALKTALQSTLRAKEDDLKMYMEMIEETKRVFLHGIQQVRKTSSHQS